MKLEKMNKVKINCSIRKGSKFYQIKMVISKSLINMDIKL